ncbi:SDR family NAD(P)-dependent oxidoreductase [Alkalicoccobacillus plakortidis]|uniref:Glucose 1-dehydrogenase n=1 Tax=Alkalicoccobacillus plakortidis TaxID=444060 RepID=A0ABT0XKE7_9BACI|nr:glucose 1-dehydrogenase [Alkalicoccobacillus plakortidis]MCM2676180.1 glucose 1-dehydrogenase [Alkalicoccobacillus plakortidis]
MRLKTKIAIVTGASQGIGEGITRTFAREGASVVVADVNTELGTNLVNELKENGVAAYFVEADVSKEDQVKQLINKTVDVFGGVDILINNAAMTVRKSVEDTTFEEWQQILGVNLTGAFLCSKYAIAEMKKRGGGAIVNIASWHAEKTITRLAAYAASKGGLTALTRQMSLDLGPHNIRVNAVCPSTVDTPLLEKTFASLDDPEEAFNQTLKFQPFGRIGTVDDIANACLFMVSDEATYVSGQTLMVDGAAINKIARPLMFD